MSNGGMIGLMPRTKRGLVVFFSALLMLSLALQYASAMAPQRTLALTGAVFTSNFDGTGIDLNIYDSKGDVYLTGGPCQGGSHLQDGEYYYQVTSPNGELLSNDSITDRHITVSGGFITATSGHVTHDVACTSSAGITVQLLPYDDTPNPGGEYKLTVGVASQVAECDAFEDEAFNFVKDCKQIDTKSDNYKVGPNGDLKILKTVDGGTASGDFTFHVDCGQAFEDDVTVTFPDPGFVTVKDLPEGTECTVTETGMPNPPANFVWDDPTITGSPATIGDDTTVTVTVANHLVRLTGSLKVTKAIPGVPEGYSGSFGVHVTCDEGGPFDATIAFPDPGFVTINNIPAGATCAVIETTKSAPPAGFLFAGSNVNGPVTIAANQTAELTVTNLLTEQQGTPVLTIDKSNNAPLVNGLPTADVGDTVTYTLAYTLADGPAANGVIKDVLPTGVTYVTGSATNSGNGEFVFQGYDSGTRTLTWTAASVTASGSVTYKATVDEGAAALAQPLVNTATIDSDDTEPDSDTSQVFVAPPPLAETAPPTTTAPPTDVAGTGSDSSASGGSMLLVLLALAGVALAVTFMTPTPAAIRKRLNR